MHVQKKDSKQKRSNKKYKNGAESLGHCYRWNLLLLLGRSLCPIGVRIVGWWCYIPCTESKETLYYVPIWFIALLCIHYRCPISRSIPCNPPTLLFHPLLVRLRRRRQCLPCLCQVNSCLFPPPHSHPLPLIPLCRLIKVQKWLHSNIMHRCILPSPNICLHRLKPRLRSRRLHQGVLPLPV